MISISSFPAWFQTLVHRENTHTHTRVSTLAASLLASLWLKTVCQQDFLFIRLICDTSVAGDCAVNIDNNSTKARFGWILQFVFPLISFQLFLRLVFLLCVCFIFLHVLLERLPFVTSRAWSLTHLVSLAVGVIVFKVAGSHFSCKRFAYLYGVVFVCYQKKKNRKCIGFKPVAGERSASRLKFPTRFDFIFIFEQIGSIVIDRKKWSASKLCIFFIIEYI